MTAVRNLHGHERPVSFSHPSSQDRMKKERQADLGPGSSAPLPGGTVEREDSFSRESLDRTEAWGESGWRIRKAGGV